MNDEISDEEFRRVLQACPISVHELAAKLSVRRPEIERWLAGKDLPGQAIREAAVEYLTSLGEHDGTPTSE